MIKYIDGEPKDMLPVTWVDDDEIAISYAIRMAVNKLISFQSRTKLYADIDAVPEDILDLMALEMRTQYYDESLEIEKKRELVKNTLAWYEKAGTTGAVEEMVTAVFTGAKVTEWYDMPEETGAEPGTFAVDVIDSDSGGDRYKELLSIIKNVKMASAHLLYLRRVIELYLSFDESNRVYVPMIRLGTKFFYWSDIYRLDGTWLLDGSVLLTGFTVDMPVAIGYIIKMCLDKGSSIEAEVTIKKNLWYLDGTYDLTGSRLLNAEIKEEVL